MDGLPDSKILIKQPSMLSSGKKGGRCFTRRMHMRIYGKRNFNFIPINNILKSAVGRTWPA